MYMNTPKGFETLMPQFRDDAAFRQHFLTRLRLALCTGEVPLEQEWALSCIACTETGPFALFGGAPPPGMDLKLVPGPDRNDGKFEARVKGPNVTWGYWRRLDQTRAAIDEEGFFKLGDNLRFADEADPSKGLVFDSRTL
jgi:feruloyl-CoA synthase